jgi:hypothetical protein
VWERHRFYQDVDRTTPPSDLDVRRLYNLPDTSAAGQA